MPAHSTITQTLDWCAHQSPDRICYRFLDDTGQETQHLTFGQLREHALRIATRLQSLNTLGERAILIYPQGPAFLAAFLGCLYAGVIATPISVPNRKRGLAMVRCAAVDCGARLLLSTEAVLKQLEDAMLGCPILGRLECLDTENLLSCPGAGLPELDGSQPAFLQYTSGTTGFPRGVLLSHRNLTANQAQVAMSLGANSTSVIVSWLPMFHDMGLGIALQSITAGATCILLPPRVIVHQPRLWLSAITNYRGSISGAPNFAYDLCVRRINETERAQLDLSCWQVAYNGSEPLRQATLDRFTRAFEVAGFRHSAFHPVYGLAEATVLVRSPPPSQPPLVKKFSTNALRRGKGTVAKDGVGTPLVSHGGPWLDTVVMIVNPRTRKPCDEGEVGEIWIQGSSVARQYWRDDVPSDATVNSSLSGKAAYLCTGDLGFVHENNLYITGRLQDLIVFGEQQYYPQDVESTVAECHSSLVPYGCAAFALEPAEAKHLVVVQEVERTALRKLDRTQVVRTIRDAVLREHGIGPQAVALVRPATLPRTSSGKIRRFSCRAAFLDQSLDTVVTWWATDPLPRSSEAASGCISSKTDPLRAC